MNQGKRIGYAGCKNTTLDCMSHILRLGYQIDTLITLTPEQGENAKVAGYYDLSAFAREHGIRLYRPRKYSLLGEVDRRSILEMGLDLLLTIGWQRLIPEWLLESLPIGACGMHGSSEPLPVGRGRSPLNWSLIQNKERFITHLILYKPGVDNGDIIDAMEFDITPFDTCHTLHLKNVVCMNRLLQKHLPVMLNGSVRVTPQSEERASYYPKREAQDGIITWEDSSLKIYNSVRAVTRPFPGAFSFLSENRVMIWSAIPFDSKIRYPAGLPGEIVEVFWNGQFVVKTGDTSILVLEYETDSQQDIRIGGRFHSCNIEPKRWKRLPIPAKEYFTDR